MFPAQALHVGGMAERGLGSFSVPSEAKAPHMTPYFSFQGQIIDLMVGRGFLDTYELEISRLSAASLVLPSAKSIHRPFFSSTSCLKGSTLA